MEECELIIGPDGNGVSSDVNLFKSRLSLSILPLSSSFFPFVFHFFACFVWFCRFGLLDFFFFFTFFFLDLHRLLIRLDDCGSSVNETKGAQVFFFCLENFTY